MGNNIKHLYQRKVGCSPRPAAQKHVCKSHPPRGSGSGLGISPILDWYKIIAPNSRNGMIICAPHSDRSFYLFCIRLIEDLILDFLSVVIFWKRIPTANSRPGNSSLITDIEGGIPLGVLWISIQSEVASLNKSASALVRNAPLPANTSVLHEICVA